MLIEAPSYISSLQHLLTSGFLKSKVPTSVHNQAIREVEELQSFLHTKNKHIFGFFVTLKRGHLDTRKVFPMIEDTQHACVQGCMGHWNNDFNKYLDNQMIVSKIIGLVETIQDSDSRYRHFVRFPLKKDPDAYISITFMIAPIYLIDIQSGYLKKGKFREQFNNRDYGIISELNGQRATYLPHVFPDKNFHEIKTSLLKKAGISLVGRSSNVNFYAYDCCIYDCKLNKHPQSLPKSLKNNISYLKKTFSRINQPLKPEKEFFLSKKYQLNDLHKSTVRKIPNITALITPHAGLSYSGDLCLWAYQRLQSRNYNQIIIFSTNHQSHQTVIPQSNYIYIQSLGRQFKLHYPRQLKISLHKNDLEFSREHSWLSHLPFLNLLYPDNKSITLSIYLIGQDFQKLIDHYQQEAYQSKRTLFLFNTDLLHCGPNYGNYCPTTPQQLDVINQQTLESIKNLYLSEVRRENLCGYDVIQLFIQLSLFHNWKFKDSNYNTSYRVNHEEYTKQTNSVGYGSMIFTR